MAVKRKSNWYIYFIAFGIALAFALGVVFTFRDFLFRETTQVSTGLTSTGELSDDFKPDDSHSFTIMTMLGDETGSMPALFIMVRYNAVENTVVYITLPNGISVPDSGRTLPNVYAAQGGAGVITAAAEATGVTCDGYIAMDRQAFSRLISSFGNVEYNVPKTLLVTDGTTVDAFNTGLQIFSPEAMFRYIYLAEFTEGESYRFSMIGDVFAELINQNFRSTDSSLLDNYFKIITEVCETDLTQEFYNSKKAALLNTVEYGSDIAEFYVPYGEYGEDGSFTIAANSLTTISQKCGMYE